MRATKVITHEPDEKCRPVLVASVAFQGILLALAPTVATATLFAQVSGLGEKYLAWSIMAAVAISGITTAVQAARLGRLGGGHILITGMAPSYIAAGLVAVQHSGPGTLASLVVVVSLLQFALAWWLPTLRRVITPLVSGVVVMLIAAGVMPVAFGRLSQVPDDAPSFAGLVVGAVTLIVVVVVGLRATGVLRLWGALLGMLAGTAVAVAFGMYDPTQMLEAPWIGMPTLWTPDYDLTPGVEFWTLLPTFALVAMAGAIKSVGSSVVVQRTARRESKVTDYRLVQGAANANGLGTFLSGLAGILPTGTYDAATVSLTNFTGVAARSVGYAIGGMLILTIFVPKAMALLLTIPPVVMAAYLLAIMGMLFVEATRTVFQEGLGPRRSLILGVSLAVGLGIQSTDVRDLFGGGFGLLAGDGMLVGTLTAVLLTAFVEFSNPGRKRLRARLDESAFAPVDEFLGRIANRARWDEESTNRLRFVGEETLTSLLENEDADASPRKLVVTARPTAGAIELEFLGVLQEENLEDHLAYVSGQARNAEESLASLRLLRHFASAVHHRKYHGLDIVTVEVAR